MSPIGHIAVGLATKRATPKVSLAVLLLASWIIDVIYLVLAVVGIAGAQYDPSHVLLVSLVLAALSALLAMRVYRDRSAGLVIGLLVLSHWVLDFFCWGNLPVFFAASPALGLGLYNHIGDVWKIALELALLMPAIVVYMRGRSRKAAPTRRQI